MHLPFPVVRSFLPGLSARSSRMIFTPGQSFAAWIAAAIPDAPAPIISMSASVLKTQPPKKPEQKKTVRPLICVGFLVLFLTAVYTSGAVFTRTAAAAAVSHPQHCYHCSGCDKRNDQNVLKSQRISPPTVYTANATIQAMMHWEMTTVRVLSPEFSSLRTAATAATHGV